MENIPSGDWIVKLSFLGYTDIEESIHIGTLNENYDLGKVILNSSTLALESVVIKGKRSTVSSGLERKSFAVEHNVAQSGGSVLRAMQNLPSVTVSSDGVVSLRGSDEVLVLIDGKQSSLTGFGTATNLDNISASNVERIEIINNPSAKFDAKGNAGIINIIYKKRIKKGVNGEVGLALGIGELTKKPQNLTNQIPIQEKYAFTPKIAPNFSLNYRSEKVNYFVQVDGLIRKKVNSNIFSNRTYDDGSVTNQQFSEMRQQAEYNVKFGADWFLNDNDKLTVYGLWQDEYHSDYGDVPYLYNDPSKNNRLWQWTE